VLGPTGVGKTTLRAKIEQLLTAEMLPALSSDPGRIPVVSVECVAPEAGSFSWRAHFRRLLLQMEEPLIDYKIDPEAPVRIANMVVRFTPSEKAVGAEYQHAVERALAFRRPAAVLIDEAQHLAKMGTGRRLADQLDVIKSLANRTKTVHVLFGTYELLAFRNLSAQLSRRSIDVHFPRYRLSNPGDAKAFRTVLGTFEQQLPVREPPDLVKEWEYLYERSVGCVGILKADEDPRFGIQAQHPLSGTQGFGITRSQRGSMRQDAFGSLGGREQINGKHGGAEPPPYAPRP
jgi:hypothetical protein